MHPWGGGGLEPVPLRTTPRCLSKKFRGGGAHRKTGPNFFLHFVLRAACAHVHWPTVPPGVTDGVRVVWGGVRRMSEGVWGSIGRGGGSGDSPAQRASQERRTSHAAGASRPPPAPPAPLR